MNGIIQFYSVKKNHCSKNIFDNEKPPKNCKEVSWTRLEEALTLENSIMYVVDRFTPKICFYKITF